MSGHVASGREVLARYKQIPLRIIVSRLGVTDAHWSGLGDETAVELAVEGEFAVEGELAVKLVQERKLL